MMNIEKLKNDLKDAIYNLLKVFIQGFGYGFSGVNQ